MASHTGSGCPPPDWRGRPSAKASREHGQPPHPSELAHLAHLAHFPARHGASLRPNSVLSSGTVKLPGWHGETIRVKDDLAGTDRELATESVAGLQPVLPAVDEGELALVERKHRRIS